MKAKKKTILLHNMLLLLTENDYISVSKMASILDLSESTIRRNIDLLADTIENAGYGTVLKVPGKGLHLIVKDNVDDGNKNVALVFGNQEIRNIVTDEHQLYKYLFTILSAREKMTLYRLSEIMYDSIPVVRKKLLICDEWLSLFGLQLNVKRNYGIALEGEEGNIRLAIKHLILNNDLYDVEIGIRMFARGMDVNALKQCISDIEKEWNFKFTEESFHSMLIYAALSIDRQDRFPLALSDTECQTVYRYNEYNWAKSLFRKINERFSKCIHEKEIVFFAIQLLCSGMIHDAGPKENNAFKYDEKMKGFIRKIISVISDVLNVDLTQDTELYYGLLNHIRPAIFRMRFEKHSTKSLTDFIKEEFKETYRVSWTLSILFEEYYGINISSTELSYITLYIQSALERRSKSIKMALVTELGMGLNQMFCNKIKMAVPKVETISIISLHEFSRKMLEEYDLIVTTSSVNVFDERIIQMNSLLNESGIALINQRIKQLNRKQMVIRRRFDVTCHSLFDPRLIFTNVSITDKQKLIEMLAQELVRMGYVTDKYVNTILKREKTVSTNIGNGVAIPHGNSNYVNDSKVAIAFLQKGIQWNEGADEKVDTVFLLAFRIENADSSKRVRSFYKVFLELIQTDESIKCLREMSSEELYKYLVQ